MLPNRLRWKHGHGVNDQWEPKRSSDISKPYHYWWLKNGTVETLAYEFDQPYTVSNVQVYWLDFDHYDGDFRVPESWKLYYKEGESWKEVEALTEYTVKKITIIVWISNLSKQRA